MTMFSITLEKEQQVMQVIHYMVCIFENYHS